jgi:hypothetical protein
MFSVKDVVRCNVRDGEMWMHLDNGSLKIPPQLLSKSKILLDALSAAHSAADVTRKLTVGAPKEWLQAWWAATATRRRVCTAITSRIS